MMKVIIVTLMVVIVLVPNILGYDPPKSLTWGMSYIDAITSLDEQGIEVKELNQKNLKKGYREYSELQLPEGFFRAEAKKVRLMDNKVQRTYLIFDADTNLVAFHYILKWNNDKSNKGARKCWVFHSDIKTALLERYGDPIDDETSELVRGSAIPSGIKYGTIWRDADSSLINLVITRQTHNIVIGTVDGYLIFVIYSSPEMVTIKDEKKIVGDDL